ncbi:MAG: endolytic transglycosylase MltG [Bacteroidetes bacterium]|nr:endolytic transglycosylase MltG [Bacteroidota bacterium]
MKKWILWSLLVLLVVGITIAAYFYSVLFGNAFEGKREVRVRIRSGWNLDKLADVLQEKAAMKNKERFVYWVNRLGYKKVKPCTIKIPAGCSMYQLADILKKNRYQTTNITILGSMDKLKLATLLANKLEMDADSFVQLLSKPGNILNTGFTDTTWQALFVANTYNFAVATNTEGFMRRMVTEHRKFWNDERMKRAAGQGLTPLQVVIVASIVTKESNKTDEYENIAGVYLNRLRKGMLLQADPTVVYVRNHTGRVTGADLKIESPYNTYLHEGLPPGPICIPNISSMEAVLNYSGHHFLYFVAMPDFSGYHHFSATLAEHNLWARKFHQALNQRNIR